MKNVIPALFISLIPSALLNVLPATLMLSVLIAFIRLSLKPLPPLPAGLSLAGVAFLLFTGGLLGIGQLQPRLERPDPRAADILVPGRLNRFDDLVVLPGALEYEVLLNTLVLELSETPVKTSFHPRALAEVRAGQLEFHFGDRVFDRELVEPARSHLLESDQFSAGIIEAFHRFSEHFISQIKPLGLQLFFSSSAFVLFLITSGLFARITRWPLFNTFLYGAILVGVVLLHTYYQQAIFPELQKIIENNFLLAALPNFFFLGLSVFFVLIDILFIPRKYWKEGIAGD